MKPWQTAALVGGGALVLAFGAAALLGKKASASSSPQSVPKANTGHWRRMSPGSDGNYHLATAMIYVLAGNLGGATVDEAALKSNFGAMGIQVLEVSSKAPSDFPNVGGPGLTYVTFAPEKDMVLPPPSGGMLFELVP